jgi:hypothetical protein
MARGVREKKCVRWRARFASLATGAALFWSQSTVRAEETVPVTKRLSPVVAYGVWFLAQLVPSPLLVTGVAHVGSGMRWQVTPLLYSFGIAESPFRTFVVSPIARHSGSVELHASPEWACCAPGDRTSWLLRAGLRVYLPIVEHGEVLSWSVGGSYFRGESGGFGGDLGIYTLSGVVGLNVTVAPQLERREVVTALTIRYF